MLPGCGVAEAEKRDRDAQLLSNHTTLWNCLDGKAEDWGQREAQCHPFDDANHLGTRIS